MIQFLIYSRKFPKFDDAAGGLNLFRVDGKSCAFNWRSIRNFKRRMHQPLIQPWSRINATSGLNICKMVRTT